VAIDCLQAVFASSAALRRVPPYANLKAGDRNPIQCSEPLKRNAMIKKPRLRTFDEVLSQLRSLQFDVQSVPEGANRQRVAKNDCAIVLEKADNAAGFRMVVRPGPVFGGEIAQLVDHGFQKFFKTSKAEIPATADRLKTLHGFVEELKQVAGSVTLYNEALGTVSDAYLYDRVKGRDLPLNERPAKAWETPNPH
jgi:hypothetical protein